MCCMLSYKKTGWRYEIREGCGRLLWRIYVTSFCLPIFKHTAFYFPPAAGWSNDKELSLLAVGPLNKEIFDFHKKDSRVCFKAWQSGHHFMITSTELFQNGKRATCFPLISFHMLVFCKREHSALLLQSAKIARPRAAGLPTCEALQGFTPTRKWRRHFCRQQTTFAAFILSLQKG